MAIRPTVPSHNWNGFIESIAEQELESRSHRLRLPYSVRAQVLLRDGARCRRCGSTLVLEVDQSPEYSGLAKHPLRSIAIEMAVLFLNQLEPRVAENPELLVSTEAVLSFAIVR